MKARLYLSYAYNYILQKAKNLRWNSYYVFNKFEKRIENITLKWNLSNNELLPLFVCRPKSCFSKKEGNLGTKLLDDKIEDNGNHKIILSKKNDKIQILNDKDFAMIVPKKPILEMYLECEEKSTHILVNLMDNIYNIDKRVPLYAAILMLENIDVKKWKHIHIKYFGHKKTLDLDINLNMEHIIEI